ncbi:GNAT family N-acetyltransferase [Allorhizocola rhizosphaerae]|uniref:GNAT family N-acetyltransferase n=1 Tax=Allorhizocola rhizosphaerae TaxID=1872709 RepID=UPI001B8C94EF|nr:GNAT family N-acetyltransferase [Allorhizocola rhizosphaerae]
MPSQLDPRQLLAAYDAQLRARPDPDLPERAVLEWDGPLMRVSGVYTGGFVEYRDLGGLTGDELDAFIARQRDHFAARGEEFEWKTRGHDLPEDLPQRLLAAGFVPQERETVIIGLAADHADAHPPLPEGVTLRETRSPADFGHIAELNTVVWETDMGWLSEMLSTESTSDNLKVYVAEADGRVVSAAWIRFVPGTDFAGLWGGSTLKEYRGRGLYRALVAVRAADAVARGHKYLQVDASDDSRPILERLGFVAVTTTTPYMWRPSST